MENLSPGAGDPEPIRVLVVDDQTLVRRGLVALLGEQPGIVVVGEAENGADAIVQCRAVHPQVVLMDIRMPVLDGLAATRRITGESGLGGTRVVVLTTFDLDEYVDEALRAGACGFLLKHAEPAAIAAAIRAAAAGDAMLAPEVTRRLIAAVTRGPGPAVPDPALARVLTDRELEAVRAVARGESNDEIASRWGVSAVTVRTHVHRAMAKLGARDRAHLVVIAYRGGLVTWPEDQHPR